MIEREKERSVLISVKVCDPCASGGGGRGHAPPPSRADSSWKDFMPNAVWIDTAYLHLRIL